MGWAESMGLRLLGWELGLRPVLKNGSRAFCCKLKKRSREEQKKLAENSTLEEKIEKACGRQRSPSLLRTPETDSSVESYGLQAFEAPSESFLFRLSSRKQNLG